MKCLNLEIGNSQERVRDLHSELEKGRSIGISVDSMESISGAIDREKDMLADLMRNRENSIRERQRSLEKANSVSISSRASASHDIRNAKDFGFDSLTINRELIANLEKNHNDNNHNFSHIQDELSHISHDISIDYGRLERSISVSDGSGFLTEIPKIGRKTRKKSTGMGAFAGMIALLTGRSKAIRLSKRAIALRRRRYIDHVVMYHKVIHDKNRELSIGFRDIEKEKSFYPKVKKDDILGRDLSRFTTNYNNEHKNTRHSNFTSEEFEEKKDNIKAKKLIARSRWESMVTR